MTANISIVICTRNRADGLARTLESLEAVEVPDSLCPEILVVDNASTDQTAEAVRKYSAAKIPVRYLLEPSPGKSRALNASLAQARGDIILFTDDDVAPARDWLERLGRPLLERECDAAVGRIELAKDLCRPWMRPHHLAHLAVFPGDPRQLIGANMGFHRSVLDRVPGFDVELGPGASGFGEETLFSWQLSEAGIRVKYIPEAVVVHHPDPSRLLRSSWLASGRRHGVSLAYLMHHWQHEKVPFPRLRRCYVGLKLRLRRLLEPPPPLEAEGAAPWEISYVAEMEQCRQFLIERRRPGNYSRPGLRKRGE